MRSTLLAVASLTVLLFAGSAPAWAVGPARAADTPPATATAAPRATPPALDAAIKHGFKIIRSFEAVSGLTGWVVHDTDGQYNILYTTADGQTLLTGPLLTGAGEDLSQQYAEQYLPRPDLTALWNKFEKASVVITGTTAAPKSAIYVIMDPNCIFCHLLWIALKPYEAAGLQVRWIPVGFLHADSAAKAAAVLKGGTAAMQKSQQNFDVNTESGGIAGIRITPALKAKLDANLALMHAADVQGTPGVFYKDSAGHVLHSDGMPPLSDLSDITGLPTQPEHDPLLARFEKK
ncbi:MAG TPA: thiol:disulfide interchange protein DsbG [Steroidobacteraceae bacterium]|jgi:thiol:disulfide interchange protein DsbG|nr:thiol:disulfide interchange protein DsbG [Steroidobacteraceae bacterium]